MNVEHFLRVFFLCLAAFCELAAVLIPDTAPASKHRVRLIAGGLFFWVLVVLLLAAGAL